MHVIQAILTIDTDNLPANFQEIVKHEQAIIAQWKAEGILEHFFLRQTKNGAVLIFKGVEEEKVVDRPTQIACVPLKIPALGMAVTVMEIVFVAFGQPPKPVTVYVMVAIPAETPVTTPEFVFTVAMALLEELQVPPAIVEFKFVIFPTQIA